MRWEPINSYTLLYLFTFFYLYSVSDNARSCLHPYCSFIHCVTLLLHHRDRTRCAPPLSVTVHKDVTNIPAGINKPLPTHLVLIAHNLQRHHTVSAAIAWLSCQNIRYILERPKLQTALASPQEKIDHLVPCLILVSLFLNIPRLFQNVASIIFGPLNKFVVHLMTELSALLPLLLFPPDSIMLTPFFYMAFQLNTSLVSSAHKIPLHVLSRVLALLSPAHSL